MTTQKRYEILRNELNEQQWRLYLGTEALTIGYGVISQVAALSGADWKTVQRGVKGLKGERLRAQGYDVLAATDDPSMASLPDDELLTAATAEGRALVTENVKDFDRLIRGLHAGISRRLRAR